eukprot:TRINITY_DN4157_c0_g1_i1.p1 TRINITY_DN4157_c0_g1~~TRINITY_DN4157_c0_g1_i1.p1  ORF type:complete len:296 (+),score=68.20 TRINITY_DN4157_c0_g1_i1:610-1497(+)
MTWLDSFICTTPTTSTGNNNMPVLWQSTSFQDLLARCRAKTGKKLAVVSDFDRTLTIGNSIECHILVARSNVFSTSFKEDMKELDEISLIEAEKRPVHLTGVEWWRQYNRLLKKHSVKDDDIKSAVVSHPKKLMRPGVADFHETCHTKNIPFVVVSAGITNVVRWAFDKEHGHLPAPHIISNTLDAESTSHPQEDPITSSTKHKAFHHAPSEVHSALSSAHITLVLGDRPADVHVLESHPYGQEDSGSHHFVKIGLINDLSKLPAFKESFDIILDGHDPEAFGYIHDTVLLPLIE